MIWSEPWNVLREVEFRPGLNIIWSPDPVDHGSGEKPAGPGHGAGKTLVCRLLRYCLGEPGFAADVQRAKIAGAFREGRVGAEVILDGVCWAVIRSIGVLPFNVVREGSTLAEVTSAPGEPTGMEPLVNAITHRIVTAPVSALLSSDPGIPWLAALEWIARDQECRFGKVHDWRDTASASGSPRLSGATANNVLRALLGAITPREHSLESDIKKLEKDRETGMREAERYAWGIARSVSRIARSLGQRTGSLRSDGLAVAWLRAAAADKLTAAALVDSGGETASLEDLEARHDEARAELSSLHDQARNAEQERTTARALAEMIVRETPGLSASIDAAETPTCPLCEVPVDRALVDGCQLSHKLADLASLRQRRERNEKELSRHRETVATANNKLAELVAKAAAAKTKADALWQQVLLARRLRRERTDAWYGARRAQDDIADLEQLVASKQQEEAAVSQTEKELSEAREAVAIERAQHAKVFARLEAHFDPIVRELLGPKASGRIRHDGNGLHLVVDLGGERSTPAIDTVKVLAFDLAALCRGIEGDTHVPALLIHDSPREGDLGMSHYEQLFRLSRDLESLGATPLFQYIVTTTTRPPTDLAVEPWLRLELHGAPAEKRLLRRDL
ncbi:MAG: chromosome segregation protein SMC [Deltaproteobacteria bacterium]|nr:chromosome segregation protein SMC [Kofleriaceae bacterium]